MEWLTQLTSNPLVQQVAGNFLVKPQPVPKVVAPLPTAAPTPVVVKDEGMSKSTMMMIGGGLIAFVLVIVMAFNRK